MYQNDEMHVSKDTALVSELHTCNLLPQKHGILPC